MHKYLIKEKFQSPIKGLISPYDPHNFDDFYADEYGGYGGGGGAGPQERRGGGPPNFRSGGGGGGGRPGDNRSEGNRFNNFRGPSQPHRGQLSGNSG